MENQSVLGLLSLTIQKTPKKLSNSATTWLWTTRELTLISPQNERVENCEQVKKRDHNKGLVENQFKLENWFQAKGL